MKRFCTYLQKINSIFWFRVVASTTRTIDSLCVFRIFVGFFLLFIYLPDFTWIADIPQAFFSPPILSLGKFFTGFPPRYVLFGLNVSLVFLSAFILLGIKARISTLIYIAVFLLLSNLKFSFGKIDHSSLLLLAMLACLSFSNWGTQLALYPDSLRGHSIDKRSLSLLAIFICFGFFTAGFEKALNWVNFDINSNGSGAWYYKQPRLYLLGPFVPEYIPFWGFKIMDFMAVLFEFSPLLFLLSGRRGWYWWLLLACIFHVINAVLFNISFISFAIVYLTFVDYTSLFNRIKRLVSVHFVKFVLSFCIGWVVLVRIYHFIKDIAVFNVFVPNNSFAAELYFSVMFLSLAIFLIFRSIRLKDPSA